jgi:type I restriction enzyme S subunit
VSFPRYPNYKSSGEEWLGEVPEHWKVKPLKTLASHNDDTLDESTPTGTEILYIDISGVDALVGIKTKEPMLFGSAPSRARRRVKHGDTIISTVRTYLRAIAKIQNPEDNLIVSTGFAVVRPRAELSPDYAAYVLTAAYFIEQVIACSTGVGYPAINASDLVRIPVAFPPFPEQVEIADFLDRETGKIDELVAEQRRLIELLKEKRQAVISHAVTKGLNPDAPMKPSGIEWLGDVPEHWEVKPLRHLGRCQNGLTIGGEAFGSGFPFVSYSDVYKNSVLPATVQGLVQSSKSEQASYSVHRGDVFFTRTSETIDEIGMSSTCFESIPNATFAGFLIRFRPVIDLHCRFSQYYFSIRSIRTFFAREMILITRASLSQDLLKRLPVMLPSVSEQIDICDFLDDRCAVFDNLVAEANRAIDLLQERRTALISAAVTGQIDVRDLT